MASRIVRKWPSAISGRIAPPAAKVPDGNTSRALAPPRSARRAMAAARCEPSEYTPCTTGRRPPTSSMVIAITRSCSSMVQVATSLAWALTVTAVMPSTAPTSRRCAR